jgi:ubiquitin-protein ligase
MNKRLLREVRNLYIQQDQVPLLQNDYLVYVDETDMSRVHAIIKSPYDSVYRHKFIRLDLVIPDNYPHSPPEVTFVNHDGVRIHPNMYENGKCCSTILNTWGDDKFEKWTSSMGIETILLAFQSFLDNNPYTYEPGGRDDPSYTVFVLFQSWYSCLIRYLQFETIPLFQQYMQNYMLTNIADIFEYLDALRRMYPQGYYNTRCFEIDNYIINYDRVIHTLQHTYNYIDYKEKVLDENERLDYKEFMTKEYACHICFDTEEYDDNTVLNCGHKFHKKCLEQHIEKNLAICPMCRAEIVNEPQEEWIINPQTKRRVKVGSRTYRYLKDNKIIE